MIKTEECIVSPGWVKAKLQDVLPINYGKGLTEKSRDGSGSVPVYGSSGIVGKHTHMLTTRETLIIGRKGSVGAIYHSPEPCWAIDTTYFVEDTESTYLKYWFYVPLRITHPRKLAGEHRVIIVSGRLGQATPPTRDADADPRGQASAARPCLAASGHRHGIICLRLGQATKRISR